MLAIINHYAIVCLSKRNGVTKMSNCTISNQVSKYCDEPEQISALELYTLLDEKDYIHIDGEFYTYDDITEMLDDDEYEKADEQGLIKMHIDKIAEIMG